MATVSTQGPSKVRGEVLERVIADRPIVRRHDRGDRHRPMGMPLHTAHPDDFAGIDELLVVPVSPSIVELVGVAAVASW